MGFSQAVKDEILVRSARYCCVCHKGKGINVEVHHIKPQKQGGDDSVENAICLCFDCHADAGHYFAGHPKGAKLSPSELLKHKEAWLRIVNEHNITAPQTPAVELCLVGKNSNEILMPVFIKEKTRYTYRNRLRDIYHLVGKDIQEYVDDFKKWNTGIDVVLDPRVKKITDYDGVIDYMNWLSQKVSVDEDPINCQPVVHRMGPFRFYKELNLSSCVIDLKFVNRSSEVLEDYKLYLQFEHVVAVDSVNKNSSATDFFQYSYNVTFIESFRCEFVPSRNVLVQGDSVLLDPICFRPNHKARTVKLSWELFARNVFNSGTLTIPIRPTFEKKTSEIFVESVSEERFFTRFRPKIVIE
jgi:hypothetical protein